MLRMAIGYTNSLTRNNANSNIVDTKTGGGYFKTHVLVA